MSSGKKNARPVSPMRKSTNDDSEDDFSGIVYRSPARGRRSPQRHPVVIGEEEKAPKKPVTKIPVVDSDDEEPVVVRPSSKKASQKAVVPEEPPIVRKSSQKASQKAAPMSPKPILRSPDREAREKRNLVFKKKAELKEIKEYKKDTQDKSKTYPAGIYAPNDAIPVNVGQICVKTDLLIIGDAQEFYEYFSQFANYGKFVQSLNDKKYQRVGVSGLIINYNPENNVGKEANLKCLPLISNEKMTKYVLGDEEAKTPIDLGSVCIKSKLMIFGDARELFTYLMKHATWSQLINGHKDDAAITIGNPLGIVIPEFTEEAYEWTGSEDESGLVINFFRDKKGQTTQPVEWSPKKKWKLLCFQVYGDKKLTSLKLDLMEPVLVPEEICVKSDFLALGDAKTLYDYFAKFDSWTAVAEELSDKTQVVKSKGNPDGLIVKAEDKCLAIKAGPEMSFHLANKK